MTQKNNRMAYYIEDIEGEAIPPNLLEFMKSILEMQNFFQAGIREIETKLDILNDEFQFLYQRNPIHQIKSRLKTPRSIATKLMKKGYPLNVDAAKEHLNDVAGIRVICSYKDDIYTLSKLLKAQDDVTLLKERDYIKNPKPNGYRSLHLIVSVPVFFSTCTEQVKVELQIRTIAMDFWASLEHELNYKMRENSPEIVQQLTECAQSISTIDEKMQGIYDYVMEQKQQERTGHLKDRTIEDLEQAEPL